MSVLRALVLTLALLVVPVSAAPVAASAPDMGVATVAQEPAEEFPEPEPAEETDPWTTRFLVPTIVVLTGIVLVLVVVVYLVRLRGRYRVVK